MVWSNTKHIDYIVVYYEGCPYKTHLANSRLPNFPSTPPNLAHPQPNALCKRRVRVVMMSIIVSVHTKLRHKPAHRQHTLITFVVSGLCEYVCVSAASVVMSNLSHDGTEYGRCATCLIMMTPSVGMHVLEPTFHTPQHRGQIIYQSRCSPARHTFVGQKSGHFRFCFSVALQTQHQYRSSV